MEHFNKKTIEIERFRDSNHETIFLTNILIKLYKISILYILYNELFRRYFKPNQ